MKCFYAINLALWFLILGVAVGGGQAQVAPNEKIDDPELMQIIAPWYGLTGLPAKWERSERKAGHLDKKRLEQFFASNEKWRLSYEKGHMVATRRYLHDGNWQLSTAGGRFLSQELVHKKPNVRSLLMQVFLESCPSDVADLLNTNGPVLLSNHDSPVFLKGYATREGGIVLYVLEQSETKEFVVVTNAVEYLRHVVGAANSTNWGGLLVSSKKMHVQGDNPTLKIFGGEIAGEYYVRADVLNRKQGIFYLRVVNDEGMDVVSRKVMFDNSNELLSLSSDATVSLPYDCCFTISSTEAGFKDDREYTVQLWCDGRQSGESTMISSCRSKIKMYEP